MTDKEVVKENGEWEETHIVNFVSSCKCYPVYFVEMLKGAYKKDPFLLIFKLSLSYDTYPSAAIIKVNSFRL